MAAGVIVLILRAAFAPPVHASVTDGAERPGFDVPRQEWANPRKEVQSRSRNGAQSTFVTIKGDFHAF
jgi:hypothetical protein